MATILIIEDDQNLAELLADRLELEGYNVYIAFTGKDGLKYIYDDDPFCVTLDIHLPDISGVEVIKKIKQEKKLPVIIITSDEDVKKDVEPYQPEAFFKKPIDFNKLKKVIELVSKKNS